MRTPLLACVALLALIPASAWSTTPCPGEAQVGEAFSLQLQEVTIDGEQEADVSAYAPYDVVVYNEADYYGHDGITRYVVFSAERSMTASDGRKLLEGTTEYYLPE